MSLKDTIESWTAGIAHAEAGRYSEAIDKWNEMPEPGAKIYFNIASMFLKLGDVKNAEKVSVLLYMHSKHACCIESGAVSQEGPSLGSLLLSEGMY